MRFREPARSYECHVCGARLVYRIAWRERRRYLDDFLDAFLNQIRG